jgi:hypothetical protein
MLYITNTPVKKALGALVKGKVSFDFIELYINPKLKNKSYMRNLPFYKLKKYTTHHINTRTPFTYTMPYALLKDDKFYYERPSSDHIYHKTVGLFLLQILDNYAPNKIKERISASENCIVQIFMHSLQRYSFKIIPKKPYPFVLFSDKKEDKELYDFLLGEFDHKITYQPKYNLLFVDLNPRAFTNFNGNNVDLGIDLSPVHITIDLSMMDLQINIIHDKASVSMLTVNDKKVPLAFESVISAYERAVTLLHPYALKDRRESISGFNSLYIMRFNKKEYTKRIKPCNPHLLQRGLSVDTNTPMRPLSKMQTDSAWKTQILRAMQAMQFRKNTQIEYTFRGAVAPCWGTFESLILDTLVADIPDAPLDLKLLQYLNILMTYIQTIDLNDEAGSDLIPYLKPDTIIDLLNGAYDNA